LDDRILANQTVHALWLKNLDPPTRDKQYGAVLSALMGIGPKDELEGMMAAQLIAAHNAAVKCDRRGIIAEQTFEGRRENHRAGDNLSRTFITLLEALNRHRGKAKHISPNTLWRLPLHRPLSEWSV
jgi:hypothetical protein